MHNLKALMPLLVLLVCSTSAMAESPVQLYYFERAPYAVTGNQGGVNGLCASPAANAFQKAGIPYKWKKMPFKRQLATIRYNKKRACGIGWFKNPERESFARFTAPIYQDRPIVTISIKGNALVKKHSNLASLFGDDKIKLLIKDGFSYGTYIDGHMEKYSPVLVSVVNSTNVQMLQFILSGRADYFFISEEEAEHIITSAGYEMNQFQLQHYSDMPAGNHRYVACSQQISPEILKLLNQALK